MARAAVDQWDGFAQYLRAFTQAEQALVARWKAAVLEAARSGAAPPPPLPSSTEALRPRPPPFHRRFGGSDGGRGSPAILAPMLDRVDHIGIAVEDLEAAKRLYGDVFGLRLVFEEEVPTEKVRVAAYDGGGAADRAARDAPRPTARSAATSPSRGPGIHHVCYRVDDLRATLAPARARPACA